MATCKDCIHYSFCDSHGYIDANECYCYKDESELVEVVCKDCEYVHFNSSSETYHCKRRGYYSEEVKPTDFCSYGERIRNERNKKELPSLWG